jgi:putative peptide zinc metalloprotease protein
MATLADSLVSSADRTLPIRKRPDLSAERQHYQGRSYWVVKDPVGLSYFRFQEEEYFILSLLDGRTSLRQIKQRFEAEFPPQKIALEELDQFLGMLHQSNLVIADVPGQGHELHRRRGERRRKELLGAVSNVLCIRFRGVDPERLLAWLYPKVRWFFAPAMVVICLLTALAALTLVTVQFDVFRAKLPAFHDFFSLRNALGLALALAVTKVLHELGHGLACKHFGGECHEMGVMILVLTPCLYCNVSDSWMLPSKWHRAAIGAAGMYVELLLASIGTFVWWFTQPGPLHYLCMDVMFVCSVSTILFNGNPLLRYDGYYILADLIEIPNLRQKASQILSRKLGEWLLGIEPGEDPFLPQRNQVLFAVYCVAAVLYRWFILLSILYFLSKVFEPYGLQIIGRLIAATAVFGLIVVPLYRLGKFFYVPGRLEQVKRHRMYLSLAGVVILLLALLLLPLPHRVICTLEIQPRDAAPVYVTVPGQLDALQVKPGQQVEAGQSLAGLRNLEIDLELADLAGQAARYQRQLENLAFQRHRDPQAGAEIPAIREALQTVEDQFTRRQEDRRRLELIAPAAGTVFPPPSTRKPQEPEDELPAWSGTPLDRENLGCYLEEGQFFCQVGDPARMEAVLVIDQADIEFIREGQPVEIYLDALPHRTFTHNLIDGRQQKLTIEEVAKSDLKISPVQLSATAMGGYGIRTYPPSRGGEFPTRTDPSGRQRPRNTTYQARVSLNDPDGRLLQGLRGRAKVKVGNQPLGPRLYRWFAQTISFRL